MINKIVNKSCLDFMAAESGNEFVNLTVTSPPYNLDIDYGTAPDGLEAQEYAEFSTAWLTGLYNITKPSGRLCLNIPLDTNKGGMTPVYSNFVKQAMDCGWNYKSTIVWNEQNISRRTAWGSFMMASAPHVIAPVEMIIVLYKGDWKRQDKGTSTIAREDFIAWTNGVWTFNGEKKKNVGGHPAAFPEELPTRCIQLFSYEGDTVFDPFVGSGTTLAVAKKLDRNYSGTEIHKDYFDFAEKRLKID